jgi:hypothetical protein
MKIKLRAWEVQIQMNLSKCQLNAHKLTQRWLN